MNKIFSDKNLTPFFIFSAALTIRALYLWQQQANPLNAYPLGDSVTYIREAERILRGDWAGDRVFTFGGAAFYPYFLALIFSVAGKSIITVQIIQFVFGALTSTLLYLTGEKLFGKKIGITLGIIASLFPPFLFHEGLLLTSSPGLLFLMLTIYLLICGQKKPRLLFAGISLGLAVLCRPNTLLLAPLFFAWILTDSLKGRQKRALLFVIGVSLVIFPVTLRNYIVGKDLVLISSSGGLNFFIGNNPDARGVFSIPQKLGISNDARMYLTSESRAREATGLPLKPSEASRFWFKKGRDFIVNDPGNAFTLLLKKTALFLNAREITNLYKFNFFSDYSPFLPVSTPLYGLTVIFGLSGAVWMLFSGTREERLISLSLFVYAFSVIIFFVSSRLRLPVSLFLILGSGYTIKHISFKRAHALLLFLFIPLALITFKNIDSDINDVTKSNFHTYTQLANKNKKSRNYKESLHFFNLAVAERPDNIMLLADAGDMALKADNPALAKKHYRKILVITENFPPKLSTAPFNWSNPAQMSVYRAMYQLGIIYYREKSLKEAGLFLKGAVSRFPPGLEAQRYLARTFAASGEREEATDILTAYLEKYPNPIIRQELIRLKTFQDGKPGSISSEAEEKSLDSLHSF